MTLKLKKGFFRVTPYRPYVPLEGDWFIREDDATFSVMKNLDVAKNFFGFSHGCGKIKSVFNRDYFVFENGAGQVEIIDNELHSFAIITLPAVDLKSIVCMNNFIFAASLSGNTLTVTQYIVAGTEQTPFSDIVATKTINVASGYTGVAASCIKNDTDAYLYQGELSGTYESVKMEVDGSDFELSLESDSIKNLIHPNMELRANNESFLFYRPVAYYSNCPNLIPGTGGTTTTNWSFSVYDADDTLQYTYTVARTRAVARAQGAKVFLNQTDGSGYLLAFDCFNNGSNLPCGRIRLFSFGGGTITELYSQDTEQINVITGSTTQNAFHPWKGVFPGYGYGVNQYISRKANLTLSGCTLANASNFTNTSTPMRFGNTIKW